MTSIDPQPGAPSTPRKASLADVAKAVLWSFFGIRKGNAMQRDTLAIKPHQVVLVGIAFAAVLVVCLLLAVRLIMRVAGA
jgi:preprotein translocase subunit Sec61beta